MNENREIFCLPEKDNDNRFIIGKAGERNLLCIGVNPNTADIDALDQTSQSIERIALNNGFDGWILVNLYPKRTKNVSLLDFEVDDELLLDNLNTIRAFLTANKLNLKTAWLAWGNDIDQRDYLKESAVYFYRTLKQFDFGFVSAGKNNSGNPTHPSPQAIAQKFRENNKNVKLTEFDFENYVSSIKKSIKIRPEITVDGKEWK